MTIVKCGQCEIKPFCLARLADRTISGCGLMLYRYGLIRHQDVMVEHTVKEKKHES